MREYNCVYGGKDEEGKPHVKQLEEFSQMLCDDLYEAICFEFPEQRKIITSLDEERSYHIHFTEHHNNIFIGRIKLLSVLEEHANGELKKGRYNSEGGILPLVVIGDPGSGKSSLVAAFSLRYASSHPSTFVLTHIVGASPKSTDVRLTLLRFIEEISEHYNISCLPESRDYVSIKNLFFSTLQDLSKILEKENKFMLIIIDGVNQLDATFGAHGMDWLPVIFPHNIRCIISTTEEETGIVILKSLRARERHPPELTVVPLNIEEREEIVKANLSTYRKKLTQSQMEILVNKKDSCKPLYLLIACEELRFGGLYGMDGSEIDKKINNFPTTIPNLFAQVLDRVERDMEAWAIDFCSGSILDNNNDSSLQQVDQILYLGSTLVKYALSYIQSSRHGMKESELLEILAPPNKDKLPQAIWARLFRSLELYLTPQGEDGEGTLGFYHTQLSVAVKTRYLRGPKINMHICSNLAAYYKLKADPKGDLSWCGDYENAFKELPYFYFKSYDLNGLRETLGNLNFIKARCRLGVISIEALMRDYQDAQSFFKETNYIQMKDICNQYNVEKEELFTWLSEFLIFISSQKPKLQANPEQIFQLALNQPDTSAPYFASLRYIKDGYAPESWVDFINKPTENKLIAEFAGFDSKVTCIGLNPDGLKLIVGCEDGSLRVIDSITGELIREMIAGGHTAEITSISYDSDGSKLLSGSKDNSIIVWDAINGNRLGICTDHVRAVNFATFTPNSVFKKWTLVSGSLDMSLRLFSLKITPTEELAFNELWIKDWMTSPALSAAFTQDSSVLVTGCSDGNIIFWDSRTPSLGLVELIKYHAHSQAIRALAFGHLSWLLVTGSDDKTIKYWDVPPTDGLQSEGPNNIDTINAHTEPLRYITFNNSDDILATCGEDNKVYVWNAKTREKIFSIIGHNDIITCAQFANEGKQILTSSHDETIKRWDITLSSNIQKPQNIERVVVYADACTPAQKRKLNRQANTDIEDLFQSPIGRHTSSINIIKFSTDCKYCITGSTDFTCKIWTVPDGVEVAVLIGHVDSVNGASFYNDNSNIITADKAGNIMIWSLFKHLMMIETDFGAVGVLSGLSDGVYGLTCIEVTKDNNYCIAGYQDGQLRKFDLEKGKEIESDDNEEFSHEDEISNIRCTKDERIISSDIKGIIKVWDKNLKLIMQLSGFKDSIMDIRLMRGDSRIVAISKDRSIKIWDRYHKIEAPILFLENINNNIPLSGSISNNCDYAVTSLDDHTIYVISMEGENKGDVIGSFITYGDISATDIYSEKDKKDDSIIACGDTTGKLYLLKIQHLDKYKNSDEVNSLPYIEKTPLRKPQITNEYRAENSSTQPTPSNTPLDKKRINNKTSDIHLEPIEAPKSPSNTKKLEPINTQKKVLDFNGKLTIKTNNIPILLHKNVENVKPLFKPIVSSPLSNSQQSSPRNKSFISSNRTSLIDILKPQISHTNELLIPALNHESVKLNKIQSDSIERLASSRSSYDSPIRLNTPTHNEKFFSCTTSPVEFDTDKSPDELEPFSIIFPNNHRETSVALLTSPPSNADDLIKGEKILNSFQINVKHINYLICTFGGASGLNPTLMPILRNLIDQGVMNASKESGAVMIDGGTDSGIMQIVGRGKGKLMRKMKLIGVCPSELVRYPGKECNEKDDLTDLEPHHSHFVLVKSKDWGGETSTMFSIIKYLMQTVKAVGILVNGGGITINEALNAVKAKMPLIVIEGSARTADVIASAWRIKIATNSTPDLDDPRLKTIISDGNLFLYHIKSGSEGLTNLILQLLELKPRSVLTLPLINQRNNSYPNTPITKSYSTSPLPQKRAVMILKK